MSNLYKTSNIMRSIKSFGYDDLQYRPVLEGGVIPTFYSQKHNVAIIGLDSNNLAYDRINTTGRYTLLKRALESHPLKPSVHTVNVLLFNQGTDDQDRNEDKIIDGRIKLLQDAGIPQNVQELDRKSFATI